MPRRYKDLEILASLEDFLHYFYANSLSMMWYERHVTAFSQKLYGCQLLIN